MYSEFYDPERQRNVSYHELCPHTPVILFNHYWDDIPTSAHFPKTKQVYMMPNIEMYELNERHFWNVDVVLCKTRICEQRLAMWYAQEGNPRGTRVFFVHHTTSDAAGFAEHVLGPDAIKPRNFVDVRFTHVAGGRYAVAWRAVLALS
ncbi:hypothetical protein PybrP1_007076 [[Pythium] brassicae (nom. inval.)]|nr:hypothetical protein PybrP1_007076 [[Pythium] brassicae (nom. inval.)]